MTLPARLVFSFFIVFTFFFALSHATTFEIRNQCPYTVWAAAVPGGGQRLNQGQGWTITVSPGTKQARIWGRTNCSFNTAGRGRCQTGDCNGLLRCQGHGSPPNTLAEYALNPLKNVDFFYISLLEGFNVPMDFSPVSGKCHGVRCAADINGQCPPPLTVPGGCNNPCTVFKTNPRCCCPTDCSCSRYLERKCPDAHTYLNDNTTTVTCPSGTNYRVTFCP